jgi:hypothetical protein
MTGESMLHQRRRLVATLVLALGLLLWLLLPMLLPDMALTQRPPEYAESVSTPDTPVSHISLPVELPLRSLEKRLTEELDASLARKREDSDFQAWRNGALRVQARGSEVLLSIPLHFKSSDGPDTKGSLVVHTRIKASIAPDWQPLVRVHSTFDWVKKPKTRLLLFKVRVSGVVGRALNKKLRELDADLRRKIESSLALKPRAQDWWDKLHQPDLLSKDPPIWLSVAPQSFYFESAGGDGENLRLLLGIRAKLATSVAHEPAPGALQPLPPLQAATEADEGFTIHLPVVADYRGLTDKLREELVGREIKLDRGAITPTDFTLYTSGRNLVVGIEFRGDAPGFWMDTRGTVYFTGEPRFDPQTRILEIENFQFTRRLTNPLLHTATWVMQDSLREKMQARLRWDLSERLQQGATELTERLNKPLGDDFQLSGNVEHLNLTRIECRMEGIQIGLEVRGQLKVSLAEPAAYPG